MKSLVIGIDFDGTMVKHAYPEIGEELELAVETVLNLIEAGHKIILYTMRSGDRLVEAVKYMEENDIKLYGINENPTQHHWTKSNKTFCNLYIDDAALGCPLEFPDKGRPQVDWEEVIDLLEERGILE